MAPLPYPDPSYIESKMRIKESQGEGELSFSFTYLEADTQEMKMLREGTHYLVCPFHSQFIKVILSWCVLACG